MRRPSVALTALSIVACGPGGQPLAESNDAGSGAGAASAVGLEPGFWETRVEVLNIDVKPIETAQGTFTPTEVSHSPPQTNRNCVTPEQASQPFKRFLTGGVASGQCNTARFSMAGGRISGSVVCEGQGERSEYSLDGRYTPISYDVTTIAKTRLTTPGQAGLSQMTMPMDVEAKVTGRRLGNCPADGPKSGRR